MLCIVYILAGAYAGILGGVFSFLPSLPTLSSPFLSYPLQFAAPSVSLSLPFLPLPLEVGLLKPPTGSEVSSPSGARETPAENEFGAL